tara:strand:+ start:567 stop:752 length:186 start_codon:yes stop_codon:yes gene_type:complete
MLVPDKNGYLCPECGEGYLEEIEASSTSGPESTPAMWCEKCDAILDKYDFMDYYEPGRDDV